MRQTEHKFQETVLPPDASPQLKEGLPTAAIEFADRQLDLTLLHNTHSWVVIAQP